MFYLDVPHGGGGGGMELVVLTNERNRKGIYSYSDK
jgi:hypothetical protein